MPSNYRNSPKKHLEKFRFKLSHGKSRTTVYKVWKSMLARCADRNNADYGGRGISVCDQWKSFESFYADMGDPPGRYQIERLDNNGNYCKENCAWKTRTEQARNKRTNVFLTLRDETKSLSEWAETLSCSYTALKARFHKKWTSERILTTPVRIKRRSHSNSS